MSTKTREGLGIKRTGQTHFDVVRWITRECLRFICGEEALDAFRRHCDKVWRTGQR